MIDLKKVFYRTFFIQAGWNYMKYQNLGFIYAIEPALKQIHSGEGLKKAYLRHIEIFNTQPYMAGFVIGNTIGMEERIREIGEAQLVKIKQSLACAYASIGDRIFWARLRISVYLSTILLYLFLSAIESVGPVKSAFLALVLPTAAYMAFSIYVRWAGLKRGYSCSGSGTCGLDFIDWNRVIRLSSRINYLAAVAIMVSALFAAFIYRTGFSGGGNGLFAEELVFVSACVGIQRYFKGKKKPLTYTIAVCFAAAFFFAMFRKTGFIR